MFTLKSWKKHFVFFTKFWNLFNHKTHQNDQVSTNNWDFSKHINDFCVQYYRKSPQIILLVNQFQRTKLLESLWCRRPKEEAGFSGLFPAGMDHKTSPWESTFAQSLRMTLSVVMVWLYGLSKNIRDHENMIFNFHLIWKDHPPACHRRKLPRLLPRWKWGSQSHRRSKPSWFSPLWFLGKMKMLWNWSEWKYKMCFKWVLWNWKLKFVKVKGAFTAQWEGDDGTNCAAIVAESHKLSLLWLWNPPAKDSSRFIFKRLLWALRPDLRFVCLTC